MAKYIAIWSEWLDRGGMIECTAEVEAPPHPEDIYKAFIEYGLSDVDIQDATIYKVEEEFSGWDIIVREEQS